MCKHTEEIFGSISKTRTQNTDKYGFMEKIDAGSMDGLLVVGMHNKVLWEIPETGW